MANPNRYFGLDIHKNFMVAVAVDRERAVVYGPRRVAWPDFERWIDQALKPSDAVVIEMTTNTWEVYDTLSPHVDHVLVVHPRHVKAIVDAQVKTDRKAAQTLAELFSANLLRGIWIPDDYTRDLRILTSQRRKMARLGAIAKNRLHAVLHRHHILPPEGFELFHPDLRPWWEALKVSTLEKVRILSDLDTLAFAQQQKNTLEEELGKAVAQDERISLLIQIPGVALLTATNILAAIGDITRFAKPKKLVGYAGIGTRVHDSGMTHHNGRSKAIVAIARRLLVAVWHVLTNEVADRHAVPIDVARSLFAHAYRVGVRNLPDKQSAVQFTRNQLDRLGIGMEHVRIPWGTKSPKLPPSKLTPQQQKK